MKKYLSILLLILFIIPSVAMASWWNPFSWFNNWTFKSKDKVILENRVAELEKKLEEPKPNQKVTVDVEKPKQTPKPAVKPIVVTPIPPPVNQPLTQNVVLTPQPIVISPDYSSQTLLKIKSLISEYENFEDALKSYRTQFQEGATMLRSLYPSSSPVANSLVDMSIKIADGEVVAINTVLPTVSESINFYENYYNDVKSAGPINSQVLLDEIEKKIEDAKKDINEVLSTIMEDLTYLKVPDMY